jgi:glycosyltransferase involved in cell wall biosynthesis
MDQHAENLWSEVAGVPHEHALPAGVSVVIPVYNSEATLPELILRLSKVLPDCSERYEAILVNDGSQDSSWEAVCRLAKQYSWVRGINLMRNFGQHNATLCGVRAARYDVTVTMDDDLQHPPAEVPKLLDELVKGYDLVYGTPRNVPHSWYRTLSSRLVKRALAAAMRQPTMVNVIAFRAFRTDIRSASASYACPRLLLDVLLGWGTTKITAVPIQYDSRLQGKSNYTFGKLLAMAILLWTSYTTIPLRLASMVGFLFVFFGVMVLGYVVGTFFLQGSIPGFPFLASLIAIFSGVQLFTLGIVGEYLANVFDHSLNRPIYLIKGMATQSQRTLADEHDWRSLSPNT